MLPLYSRPVIDLATALRDGGSSSPGAERVGEASWYAAPETPRYSREPVRRQRDSDVLRMTQMPYAFEQERVTVYRVTQREDDPGSPGTTRSTGR